MDREHILLLGASGVSGIVFINHYLTLPTETRPYLTLFARSATKFPAAVKDTKPPVKLRLVLGQLDSAPDVSKALSPPNGFPPVTTTISLLGAYVTLGPIFSRLFYDQPHPIGDAFKTTIMPQLRQHNVKRILSLSSLNATLTDEESRTMTWKWWLYTRIPRIIVPQGNEEMKWIARNTIEGSGSDIEWTVFRVPYLTENPEGPNGVALGLHPTSEFQGQGQLSRDGQAKWLLREIEERKWIGKLVMIADA